LDYEQNEQPAQAAQSDGKKRPQFLKKPALNDFRQALSKFWE